ncbi:hypothetical protein [Helicobacter pylori]|uniref:hypothetical protein n=1 Tax=Helicobacter pylori TaxID=210 RepID=UPI0019323CA1|nr:hypothetical protein [Helicobacter pylori]MBS3012827.1 hypothetical protein [Helicobacter pylori]MBS3014309.1 hypothetical protein [Helicobacter pylori]QQO40012.1 hypothetical protein [Helicobacter phage COL 2-PUJ]QQO40033.1 hypothetical protein [Helicobacter phage COL 16-PUJ]
MKQRVHSVSYLAKAEFEFKNGVYDLVALPCGAEVVKVSLEVVGNPTVGNVSVGFKDETTKNYFLKLENADIIKIKSATSAKDYTATSNKVVVAEVENANGTDAKGVLRVLYFLPSVIEVEY